MRQRGAGIRQEICEKLEKRNIIHAAEVAQYCEKLFSELKVSLILLHGSVAKGLHGKWSDIDLVVVGDFNLPFIDRIGKLLELNETRAPIEPLGYTLSEFHEMLLKFNPLALESVKNGIPLVGDKIFTELKKKLNEMEKQGLKKTKVTWSINRA